MESNKMILPAKPVIKTIGLLVAMPEEANALIQKFNLSIKFFNDGFGRKKLRGLNTEEIKLSLLSNIYYDGYISISKRYFRIKLIISGMGKVCSSLGVVFLEKLGVDEIINVGLCGGSSLLDIGNITIPEVAFYGEKSGMSIMTDSILSLSRGYKPDEKLKQQCMEFINNRFKVRCITSDRFIDCVQSEGNYVIYDMECASCYLTAEILNIPIVAIKMVSDNANDKAVKVFEDSLQNLPEKLAKCVYRFIERKEEVND